MTEAQRIFRSIFRADIPLRLEQQFDATPESVFPPISEEMRDCYERILAEVRDLEALEFASRAGGRNLLLTLKFQLMVHLAECHPELRRYYENRKDSNLILTLGGLGLQGIRCLYKLLKGKYLLRSYDGP